MALKTAQIKVNPDDGSISHLLSIECVLEPGDLERIAIMFKQHLPIDLTFTSPQSRMDLDVRVLREEQPEQTGPLDPVTLEELRLNAKVAVRTAANAEHLAETGDELDREVANASEDEATNAVSKLADASDRLVTDLLTELEAEVRQEIIDEGERQAEDMIAGQAADAFDEEEAARRAATDGSDPEALGREIAQHAAESEAAAGGDGTGAEVPEKPKRQRKARQAA